jgi:sulfur-oxidizing protein SoxX
MWSKMKRGEKAVLLLIAVVVLTLMVRNVRNLETETGPDKGIPFYSTASAELARDAMDVYDHNNCKDCHSLWTVRDLTQNVPAPILDGIGSLHDEDWFYQYFSAPDPQAIIPSRLKPEYRMPSLARLPERERRLLARYMASLKVKDWYLEETRKSEYEKLTGKDYHP